MDEMISVPIIMTRSPACFPEMDSKEAVAAQSRVARLDRRESDLSCIMCVPERTLSLQCLLNPETEETDEGKHSCLRLAGARRGKNGAKEERS